MRFNPRAILDTGQIADLRGLPATDALRQDMAGVNPAAVGGVGGHMMPELVRQLLLMKYLRKTGQTTTLPGMYDQYAKDRNLWMRLQRMQPRP